MNTLEPTKPGDMYNAYVGRMAKKRAAKKTHKKSVPVMDRMSDTIGKISGNPTTQARRLSTSTTPRLSTSVAPRTGGRVLNTGQPNWSLGDASARVRNSLNTTGAGRIAGTIAKSAGYKKRAVKSKKHKKTHCKTCGK